MLTLSINYDINVRVKRFHGQDQYILCAAFRAMMPGASALFADDTNHSAQAALDIRLSRRPRGNADAHGGAPNRPSASTSHPAFCSTLWRAAARLEKLAMVAPVTNAPPPMDGSPKISRSQRSAISSNVAAMGESVYA